MHLTRFILLSLIIITTSCNDSEEPDGSGSTQIAGYEILSQLSGHWVGSNETVFGDYPWFAFDFRPISSSHVHSIYEGGTDQNIITSVFLADYNGRLQVMARNGGWLGSQYRATYFVLDRAEKNESEYYYRLVDAVGGDKRAYMEFRIDGINIQIDAYKDNSGSLDEPIHHMGFTGVNKNPSYDDTAVSFFDFPQAVAEVDMNGAFDILLDPDSALFLEENLDPFPKSDHGYLSDFTIEFTKDNDIQDKNLLLYFSISPLVSEAGATDLINIDDTVVRTIDVLGNEQSYTTTYLHPDNYYVTAFYDEDGNGFPSAGDKSSVSRLQQVLPETDGSLVLSINITIL